MKPEQTEEKDINQTNHSTEELKQKLNQLKKYPNVKKQFSNFNHKLKTNQLFKKIDEYRENYNSKPITYTSLTEDLNPNVNLKILNRVTTVFSSAIVIGLTVGLILMAKPAITEANFDIQMDHNIEAAFNYEVTTLNTQNGNITYHTPHQFKYRWSLGVNDIIRYKENQIIMHYNNQYNIIGQDTDTYYLLREENKVAGEEVFYKNFNYDQNNGFVQLVKMEDKYLLTVFVDGVKLAAVVDYAETPYMTYSMLLMGKTVKSYDSAYVKVENVQSNPVASTKESASESTEPTEISTMKIDENGELATEVIEGELSIIESETVIEFDFSSEKRGEFTEGENPTEPENNSQLETEGAELNEGN
ncbi:MAG: hypothetical protein ACRCST_12965 [Turicibacter sp.]